MEKALRREQSERTFAALAKDFLSKQSRDGRAKSTLRKNEWVLDMANAEFGKTPVEGITAPMVLRALRKVEDRGTFETARRLKVMIGAVMRYGVSIGWINSDPTHSLRGTLARPPQKPHAAVNDPKAFGELLRAIGGFSGKPSTRIGLQLLALLYPRPGELGFAKWHEFDLEQRVWTIPADRTKIRRPQKVPLPQAHQPFRARAGGVPASLLFPAGRHYL